MVAGEHGLHGRTVTQDALEQEENKCEYESVIIQNQKMEEKLASGKKRNEKIAENHAPVRCIHCLY